MDSGRKKVEFEVQHQILRSFLIIITSIVNMGDKIEKAKKRKRQDGESSKPSKRVAVDGDKQINISVLESGKWAPVIGMLLQTCDFVLRNMALY